MTGLFSAMIWEVILLNFIHKQSILALRIEKFREPVEFSFSLRTSLPYNKTWYPKQTQVFFFFAENVFHVLFYVVELHVQPQAGIPKIPVAHHLLAKRVLL